MKPQGFIPDSASPSAHEAADLHARKVAGIGGILIGTLAVSILALIFFFHHLNQEYPGRTSEAAPAVTASDLPPRPRLQTTPLHDLEEVKAEEDAHLDRYGWVDRQGGVAQIPIDRAMVLWVREQTASEPKVSPVDSGSASASAATTGGKTELQMRQQKAQEAPHAH